MSEFRDCFPVARKLHELNPPINYDEFNLGLELDALDPCRRLVFATMIDGIFGALRGDRADQRWLTATSYLTDRYSFSWCCEILEINPSILREKLWQQRKSIDLTNRSLHQIAFNQPRHRAGRKPKHRPKVKW